MCNVCVHAWPKKSRWWAMPLKSRQPRWTQREVPSGLSASLNRQHHLPAFSDVGHATCRTTSNVLSGFSLGDKRSVHYSGWQGQQVCALHHPGLNSISCASASYRHKGPLSVPMSVSQRYRQQPDVHTRSIHGVAVADSDLTCVLFLFIYLFIFNMRSLPF